MPDGTYIDTTIALILWDQVIAYGRGITFDQKRSSCLEFAKLLNEALQKAFDAGREHELRLAH